MICYTYKAYYIIWCLKNFISINWKFSTHYHYNEHSIFYERADNNAIPLKVYLLLFEREKKCNVYSTLHKIEIRCPLKIIYYI